MNSFHIGGRVLKTALAVTVAIYLVQLFGMERASVAAIVALLTVQRTFYSSILQSLNKLGSVLLGGVLGTLFGILFGVTPLAYGLVTLIAIIICLQLGWQDNIVLTTVTAITIIFSGAEKLELYSLQHIFIALLGAICALIINFLFTPNHTKEVVGRLKKADSGLQELMSFIIKEIQEPGCDDCDYQELVFRMKKEINEGLDTAKLLREEQKFVTHKETPSDRYRQIFHIFNSQLDCLEEMHKLARRMPIEVPQATPLIKLLRIIQKIQRRRLRGGKSVYKILEQSIANLDKRFANMRLPQTHEEFVSRASLFHMFQEIKKYYERTQKITIVSKN